VTETKERIKAAHDVPAVYKGNEPQDVTDMKKVLVVDDEPDILVYLAAIFEDMGYDTIHAEGGVQAFELAQSDKPDLITLDITMPDQSGVKTYRDLRNDAELKDTPVIFITAMVDSKQKIRSLINGLPGPEGFLYKPVDIEELRKITEALLTD